MNKNKSSLKIGVFTSGGDSPGMNAALRAVVRTALYYDIDVFGIEKGYNGMIDNLIKPLNSVSVANIIQRGGTILKTARSKEFETKQGRKKAYKNLQQYGINTLVVIGGDGSFKGAHIFSKEYPINCMGIPGTIDNDMLGTEFTIGFDTAINTAITAIDRIRDTAEAHDRLFIVEVMGRDSGCIALHSGISTGAENIFVPEIQSNLKKVINRLQQKERRQKLVNLLIVAEGYKMGFHDLGKIVQEKVPHMEVRLCSLGHIQRGGAPTCRDRVLATRMGYEAVNALLKKKKNSMVGIKNETMILTPLSKAVKTKNTIEKEWVEMAKILA